MSQFDKLYEKVLSDAHFRAELVQNPQHALRSLGIEPTPEILATIKHLESAVEKLGLELGGPSLGERPFMT